MSRYRKGGSLHMTAIQIKYLEYLEGKRKNLANEALTAAQIQVEREKLAETIANNLRNYKVNVTKNEITKLANDQLNDREIRKLSETIRSNLTQENLRLQGLIEDERSHRASESLKQQEVNIKRYEAEIANNKMLIDSMNSGKSTTIFGKLFDWFRGSVNAEAISGGQVADKTVGLTVNRLSQLTNILNASAENLRTNGIIPTIAQAKPSTKAAYNLLTNRRKKEEDEIPSDFSNSRGPVANPSELSQSSKGKRMYDTPIGPQIPTNRITPNTPSSLIVVDDGRSRDQQVADNYKKAASSPVVVPSSAKSNVIISPGTNINYGPGM